MFESIKTINYCTRSSIKGRLRTIRKNPSYVFSEYGEYNAYIRALKDMDVINEEEHKKLWDIGHYMFCKYSFKWSRERIREN